MGLEADIRARLDETIDPKLAQTFMNYVMSKNGWPNFNNPARTKFAQVVIDEIILGNPERMVTATELLLLAGELSIAGKEVRLEIIARGLGIDVPKS